MNGKTKFDASSNRTGKSSHGIVLFIFNDAIQFAEMEIYNNSMFRNKKKIIIRELNDNHEIITPVSHFRI